MEIKKYFENEFIFRNKDKLIKASVVLALLILAFFLVKGDDDLKEEVKESEVTVSEAEERGNNISEKSSYIYVDISGAVNSPKVVKLSSGSRVSDAIEEAGGLKYGADITSINRAAHLNDGEKIYIPSVSDEIDLDNIGSSEGKINLNNATAEDL